MHMHVYVCIHLCILTVSQAAIQVISMEEVKCRRQQIIKCSSVLRFSEFCQSGEIVTQGLAGLHIRTFNPEQ